MIKIVGYQLTEELYQGERSLVYRAKRLADGEPLVLKVLQEQHPAPEQLARFRREYEMMQGLQVEGVVTALSLEIEQSRSFMVLEDFGGRSLNELNLAGSLSIPEFLELAIKLTEAVSQLHQHHIIHKDINPANIVLNPQTGQVKLIDLGLSSVFSHENPAFRHPNALEGTLAYLSPEQTGRMNRTVDYRTDFYSLGVTFYELLTGQRPFVATDPLELVHSHIARQPTSPAQLEPSLPATLVNIVLKLLAKNAEDRYQTAAGLQADLQTCLDQVRTTGTISDFDLGQHDQANQLRFSQKLYGREEEVLRLLAAFADACQGVAEPIFIAGHSGVGKSSLVREVYRSLTAEQGIFIEGKFDSLQRNLPYYAWQQALSQFVIYVLTESETETTLWRDKILQAVGPNAKVLSDIIPNLTLLLGDQPDVPALEAAESLNRFRYTFHRFFRTIASPERPICLFLDDLQWADTASLSLLQSLLQEALPHIFVVGAYRDNEVEATHFLSHLLQELKENSINIRTMPLKNLSISQVNDLISDALPGLTETTQLARLVHQKTEGNAFFVRAFLQTLYEQRLVPFKLSAAAESLAAIRRFGATTNVIDILVDKVQTLPPATQDILKLAACISTHFDLATLAIIAEAAPQQVSQELTPALIADILIADSQPEDELVSYHFGHDRIHAAVYSLLTPQEQQRYHWKIGNLLWDRFSLAERAERPFDILNQWRAALNLLETDADKIRFAELSLIGGRKAKTAAAFSATYDYLQAAYQLLQEDRVDYWQTHYDLLLALATETAEAAFLVSNFAKADQTIEIILNQANAAQDTIPAIEIRIQAYIVQNRMLEAVSSGLEVLRQLQIDFPKDHLSQHQVNLAYTKLQQKLGDRYIEALSDLPEMTETWSQTAMGILFNLIVPAYIINPMLYRLVLLKMIRLSIKHGYTPSSIYAYLLLGALLMNGSVDEIASGHQLSQLALTLAKQLAAPELKSKVTHQYNNTIRPWTEHLNETLPALIKTHYDQLEIGDYEHACSSVATYLYHTFYAGNNLNVIVQEMEVHYKTITKINHSGILERLNLFLQVISNLQIPSPNPRQLSGDYYDEVERVKVLEQLNDTSMLFTHYLCKLILSYLFPLQPKDAKPFAVAVKMADRAESYLLVPAGMFHTAVYYFYSALARLANYDQVPQAEQSLVMKKVADYQNKLKNWSHYAPMNFQHKWHLVEAERCRVLGQQSEARDHYEAAIDLAHKNHYVQEAALACELIGRFCLGKGQDDLAGFYLQKSSRAYEQWGALAKVHHLADLYPQFLKRIEPSPLTTISSTANVLDMHTVLKASQALSQEVVLTRLLEQMMQLVMENAGAERGILLLVEEGQWLVQAETALNQATTLLQAQPLEACVGTIATTIINYVSQTQENVILENARQADQFRHDPYIVSQQPQSILCLPIQHQGQVRGILYLENNLTSDTFTTDRIELLSLLLSQAAISLQNALLYDNLTTEIVERKQAEAALRQSERRYRALFESSNDAVFILSPDGYYLAANQPAAKMFGYKVEDILQMHAYDIIAPSDQEDAQQKLSHLHQGETLPVYERTLRKKDGTEFQGEINVALVPDEHGEPLHLQAVIRDITERKQAEVQIKQSLQEKEVLLKEIHHRVKNNMQIISSLLDLQADTIQDEAVREIFTESQQRIKSMALIHERLYQSSDLARIDFAEYIESLTNHLVRLYRTKAGNATLSLDIAPLFLSLETAIPCGLIINELVSNAFKHAFPKGQAGKISIELQPTVQGELILSVQDNGVGLPEEIDLQRTNTLGLTLVLTLVNQLKGTITQTNKQGSEFQITFTDPTLEIN